MTASAYYAFGSRTQVLRGHCTITYPKNRVDKKLDQSACFLYHKKHENTKRQNKSSLKRHFTAA